MNPHTASELTTLLKQKRADQPCPRCGHTHFSVLGEASLELTTAAGLLGGFYKTSMPTVVVGCNNCGFLTHHATAALKDARGGLMNAR